MSDDEMDDDIDLELELERWNDSPDGFAKFLARYMGSALSESTPSTSGAASSFAHEEEYLSEGDTLVYPSTPGLTRSSSIPSSPGLLLATSSPSRASSCAPVNIASPSIPDVDQDEGGYVTLNLPALTPFPLKARPIRKRMERIERRMGRLKKGKWLCKYDDKDENDEDERDELGDDNDAEGDPVEETMVDKNGRTEEQDSLDWDPFGEEEEI
jgi:hypothetical protein